MSDVFCSVWCCSLWTICWFLQRRSVYMCVFYCNMDSIGFTPSNQGDCQEQCRVYVVRYSSLLFIIEVWWRPCSHHNDCVCLVLFSLPVAIAWKLQVLTGTIKRVVIRLSCLLCRIRRSCWKSKGLFADGIKCWLLELDWCVLYSSSQERCWGVN